MKRVFRPITACAAMLLAMFLATLAQAQVLDQVPSDALFVMRLKNLNEINEKAGALAKQMGFVEMTPAAADPLGSALGAIGFNAGVDKGGDAAIVLANGNLDADPPQILMLVPVTDYKAFLGNFADVKKDGELDVFKMAPNGQAEKEDTYAANWGKYAVLTPVKELLAKKPDGFKVTGATAKEVATKDAVVIANFKILGPMLAGKIKDNREKMMGQLDESIAKEEKLAKYGPLIKAAVNQGIVIANEFLADTNAATFSINLSKEGIATSMMADFIADTMFGKLIGAAKPATGSLTAGLPDGKYILFGGGVQSAGGQEVLAQWLAPIEAELTKAGDEVKPALTLLQTLKGMMAAEKGQTMGLLAPTGAFMASPLIQSITITTGDSKTLIAGMLKMLEAQQDLMKLVPNQPASTFTVTPDAKTVDGVSFTKFVNEITGTDAASQQAKQAFAMIYGPGGAVGYTAAVDDQHVLTVAGLDDAAISTAIKVRLKDNNDPFAKSESVNLVSKNLPQNRVAAIYLDLGQLITTGTNYAKMMGMAIPVNIKPDLAPIGFAVATEGSAMHADTFIPADLVEQMVSTVLQFKMMGAGGRGKPGGL